jgi:ATP-dependent Lon protease
MAFPESSPPIRGKKDVEEFYRRLREFKLTPEQRKHFEDGMRRYKRAHASDPEAPKT